MHKLKNNDPEVYKIFSEGNLAIRRTMAESGQDWHLIHWVIRQVTMSSLKSNGEQIRDTAFKETKRGR